MTMFALQIFWTLTLSFAAAEDVLHLALRSDDQCSSGDDDPCNLNALQYYAGGKDITRQERSYLHGRVGRLQGAILYLYQKLKVLEFRTSKASHQAKVDEDVALGNHLTTLQEQQAESGEFETREMHRPKHGKTPHITKTEAEIRYMQAELKKEWSLAQSIGQINRDTRREMREHQIHVQQFRDNTKQQEFERCGGLGFHGNKSCVEGLECVVKTEYFSVCQKPNNTQLDALLLEENHQEDEVDEMLGLHGDAERLNKDLSDIKVQVVALSTQIAELKTELAAAEAIVGKYTGEAMPCSGSDPMIFSGKDKACFEGGALMQWIRVTVDRTGAGHVNVTGGMPMECSISIPVSGGAGAKHLVSAKCKGDILAEKTKASFEYCSAQRTLMLDILLPKKKETIRTELLPKECA
eukprot:TRINITY_DN48712_c0_g1_i1.p1 TRINITY_DN48712_c0_g1~~TRINITY_DN48712_c0_g1_i1.p1  ORF type:complete len:410 (-),score=82.62 TRINITY_DN48712_c0_g1_i1:146-1375(-)